jgi:hypothetical protein
MSPTSDDVRWTRRGKLSEADVTSVEDSGLDFGFLVDLALQTVYTSCTTQRAADRLALPLGS